MTQDTPQLWCAGLLTVGGWIGVVIIKENLLHFITQAEGRTTPWEDSPWHAPPR